MFATSNPQESLEIAWSTYAKIFKRTQALNAALESSSNTINTLLQSRAAIKTWWKMLFQFDVGAKEKQKWVRRRRWSIIGAMLCEMKIKCYWRLDVFMGTTLNGVANFSTFLAKSCLERIRRLKIVMRLSLGQRLPEHLAVDWAPGSRVAGSLKLRKDKAAIIQVSASMRHPEGRRDGSSS